MSPHGQAEMPDNVFQTTPAVKVTAKFILEPESVLCYCGLGCEQWGDFCPHLTYCHNLLFSYMLTAGQYKYVLSLDYKLVCSCELVTPHTRKLWHTNVRLRQCLRELQLIGMAGALCLIHLFLANSSPQRCPQLACYQASSRQGWLSFPFCWVCVVFVIIYRRYQDLGA